MKFSFLNGWKGNVSDELAKRWPEFVDCPKRLETLVPFLSNILAKYDTPKVLDAATGMGCEAVWLSEKGVDVIANEINEDLRLLTQKRAEERGLKLNIVSGDWRNLRNEFKEETFDLILLLGNSLCLLRKLRDREAAARNLRQVCKEGGSLIIDERNFPYMLFNRDRILEGQFRYNYKVMYCGKNIVGRPTQIEKDCVRFGYFDGDRLVGTLDMHPFETGEITSLFLKAGFSAVVIYSDFKKGYDINCDFYTYVFT